MKQQKDKNKKPLNLLINFIKYHNAFAIAVSLVAAGMSLTFAASPEIRQDVVASLVSAKETVRSIDNTYIVGVDLADFDFSLQITDIKEDDASYYISYAYKTIYIKDYVWQELSKQATLTITKQGLGDKDLGLYVAEELAEVINSQLSYLKEVQQMEKQKGLSQKIVSTEYAGLIGRFLDAKEETFPGYEPVVSPLAIAPEPSVLPSPSETLAVASSPAVQPIIDRDLVRQIVEELLAQERQSSSEVAWPGQATESPAVLIESPAATPAESSTPTESPVPEISPATVEVRPQPTSSVSPEPSISPSPEPTPTPETSPSPTPEPSPSETPVASPLPSPSPEPSAPPEPVPSPIEEPAPPAE